MIFWRREIVDILIPRIEAIECSAQSSFNIQNLFRRFLVLQKIDFQENRNYRWGCCYADTTFFGWQKFIFSFFVISKFWRIIHSSMDLKCQSKSIYNGSLKGRWGQGVWGIKEVLNVINRQPLIPGADCPAEACWPTQPHPPPAWCCLRNAASQPPQLQCWGQDLALSLTSILAGQMGHQVGWPLVCLKSFCSS